MESAPNYVRFWTLVEVRAKWRRANAKDVSFVIFYGVNMTIISLFDTKFSYDLNRPFATYLWPLFQRESRHAYIHMKTSFHLHVNEK